MDKKLQQKLYDKYPLLFAEKDLPMSQTCMCWGVDVGKGWYHIIERLCREITALEDESVKENPQYNRTRFSQIKEKFGLLRIYVNGGKDEEIDYWIRAAEYASGFVCENCGTMKDVTTEGGWILSLCPKCRKRNKRAIYYRIKTFVRHLKRGPKSFLNYLKRQIPKQILKEEENAK